MLFSIRREIIDSVVFPALFVLTFVKVSDNKTSNLTLGNKKMPCFQNVIRLFAEILKV